MNKTFAICLAFATIGLLGTGTGTAEAQRRNHGSPTGSAVQGCNDTYIRDGRLHANCLDRYGRAHASSIELSACSEGEVVNDNGRLACTRYQSGNQGYPANAPSQRGRSGRGLFSRQSITVFEHADLRGQALDFDSAAPNLKDFRINDSISSLRARGRWEICDDANFRGRCTIVQGEVRNLKDLGLNDRVSSLRPAPRR